MALVPIINVGLKCFTAFWALITWIVAAALIGRLNDYTGSARRVNSTNLTGANVLIAAGLAADIYFGLVFWYLFVKPGSFPIPLFVDTIAIGILSLLSLGGTAALSTEAGLFQDCSLSWCSLGSGVIGIGWIFTFLLIGILLFQVIYTLIHFDGSYATWNTPFLDLVQDGRLKASPSAGVASAGQADIRQAGSGTATTAPPVTTTTTAV